MVVSRFGPWNPDRGYIDSCGPGRAGLRQVGGERHFRGRASLRVVPVEVGDAVAPLVRLGAAHRKQRDALGAAVRELAADAGGDAGGVTARQRVGLLALDLERERALEDDVVLLLALVAVDAAALPGLEDDQVEPEALDPELVAEPHEPLPRFEVELGEGDTLPHGREP